VRIERMSYLTRLNQPRWPVRDEDAIAQTAIRRLPDHSTWQP
jgi:hypothetical protein